MDTLGNTGSVSEVTRTGQNPSDGTDTAEAVNRRRILGAALGVAGVGLLADSILAETLANPAMADTVERERLLPQLSSSPTHRPSRSTPASATTSA